MKDSNAWHNTLLEMQASRINRSAGKHNSNLMPLPFSTTKSFKDGMKSEKRWDWDSNVNKSWHYVQWVFKLNVRIECLNWMFTLMFDMHIYIECRNWIFESNGECPTCKCDLYIWILKGKVSIKDVKFKSSTRLFEDNIQMLHERFEDYHQMFNLIDWLFVCLERIIKCLNHKLKVNSKYCTAQVNIYMFE